MKGSACSKQGLKGIARTKETCTNKREHNEKGKDVKASSLELL